MSVVRMWVARFIGLFGAARRDRELAEELEAHVRMEADEYVRRGHAPAEALRMARAHSGGIEAAKEAYRDQRGIALFDDFIQDVRYAARGLMRRPGFTAVAVLTLALGIGATTAIFSAVNALILQPLPFKDPDRLMKVSMVTPAADHARIFPSGWSYPKFLFFRDQQQAFESVALFYHSPLNVTGDNPEQLGGEEVSAQYLPTLGIQVQLGTNFPQEEDAHPGAPALAIISDGLWRRRFGADPGIIGKLIELDDAVRPNVSKFINTYLVIGVMPGGFRGLSGQADILLPLTSRPADVLGNAQMPFSLVARRKFSVSAEEANRAVALLGTRMSEAFPFTGPSPTFKGVWGATAENLDGMRLAPIVRQALLVLFGAVSLVLLIACVNLASLLLGRAHTRRREIAVRLALGARRRRIVRLLMTESVLLALLGGLTSIVVAWSGALALARVNADSVVGKARSGGLRMVEFSAIHLDSTALAFAFSIAMLVGLTFGMVPALQATNPTLVGALKEGAMTTGRARGARRLTSRQFLVVSEVALALVLLIGSGLMIRSLGKLLSTYQGFDARGVLTLRVAIPTPVFARVRDSLPGFFTQLTDRLSALPGVADASLGLCPAVTPIGCSSGGRIRFLDRPPVDDSLQQPSPVVDWVTPHWFTTMRVPLLRGRTFTDADRVDAPRVVVMSETAALQFWPGDNPIGKRIGLSIPGFDDAEVIGVVGDTRKRIDSLNTLQVYTAYAQTGAGGGTVFLRTTGDPMALAASARAAINEVAPGYPVYDVQPMTAIIADAAGRSSFVAMLLALFAAVALVLAVVGIYGVMAFMVAQRTREIGIRMALGADRADVLHMVVGQGIGLTGLGAALGVVGALAATRLLRSLLYGVDTWDPTIYMAIICVIGAAAVLASWIPARRATRVDPTEALRAE